MSKDSRGTMRSTDGQKCSEIFLCGRKGPEATSFFLEESTVKFRPSRVRAPRRIRSPGSAKTTSSIVKEFSTRRIANPTLRVMSCPLAMINRISFFSLATPIFSNFRRRNPSVFTTCIHQHLRNDCRSITANVIFNSTTYVKCAHG